MSGCSAVTIDVFTSPYDKHFFEAVKAMREALTEKNLMNDAEVKFFDIEKEENMKKLKEHILKIELRAGISNPVAAFPLFVINKRHTIVGVGANFREKIEAFIEADDSERYDRP